jgi:molecular chaperone Hsp33
VVPIEHASLEECLQDYFVRSEQLPSSFRLMASRDMATGISLHALPKEKVLDAQETAEHFSRLQIFLQSLQPEEALRLDNQAVLTRLFHEESCRLFEGIEIEFGCECSLEKSLAAIISLGADDARELIDEQRQAGNDAFTVDCHFCFQRYHIPHSEVEFILRQNSEVS